MSKFYNYLKRGDVIQYYSPTASRTNYPEGTFHSQILHKVVEESGEKRIWVAQHTSNDYKNLRAYLRLRPSNEIVCIIRVSINS